MLPRLGADVLGGSIGLLRMPPAQGAVAAWGGLKGWTADRLGRESSKQSGDQDMTSSFDEDDMSASLDDPLDHTEDNATSGDSKDHPHHLIFT